MQLYPLLRLEKSTSTGAVEGGGKWNLVEEGNETVIEHTSYVD
jgi:hypothetical protein